MRSDFLWCTLLSAALFLQLGCGSGSGDQAGSPTSANKTAAGQPPTEPIKLRTYDAAAERELKTAFGSGVQQRQQAQSHYRAIRWRTPASTRSIDGDFAIASFGYSEPIYFQMRDADQLKKVQPGQQQWFDATVQEFSTSAGRYMLDAVIVDSADAPPVEPKSLPSVKPTTTRVLDPAAEAELRQAFRTALTHRYAARAKYAGTRWQLKAGVGGIAGNQAATSPTGMEPIVVEMRDAAELAKLKVGEERWLEGTAQEFGPLVGRMLVDGIVINGPSPNATPPIPQPTTSAAQSNDTRKKWHYVNAPLLFPNQTVIEGTFNKVGDVWLEDRVGDQPQDFKEVARTADYVEIARPVGDFRIRLYAGRSEYKFGNEGVWKPMFPGEWQ